MNRCKAILVTGLILLSALFSCGCMETGGSGSAVSKEGWTIIRPPSDVESLAEDGDYIWAGGKDGIYRIDRQTFETVNGIDCGFDIKYVNAVLVDKTGCLWAGFNGGAVKYDGRDCVLYTDENGLLDRRVNAIYEDKDGRILIGTWGGVSIYNKGSWGALTSEDGLLEDMVNIIYEDKAGGIWFGSYVAPKGGISYYRDGEWQYFTVSDILLHNNINAIAEDDEGGIWIGTGLYDRGGAVRLVSEGKKWISDKKLTKDDGLSGNKVRSLYIDNNGDVWFGSEYDGLAVERSGFFRIISGKDGLSDMEVKCFLKDSYGNLWIGTYDGITVLSGSAQDEIWK